jgi:hypothetical protein
VVTTRTHVRIAALTGVAIMTATLAGCAGGNEPSAQPEPAEISAADQTRRDDIVAELAQSLVPSAGGGWAVAPPGPVEVPEVWLLGAVVAASEPQHDAQTADARLDDAFDAALAALRTDTSGERGSVLAASLALTVPAPGPASRDEIATLALQRADAGLAVGDATWIGVLLNLSRPSSPVATEANAALARIGDAPVCAQLADVAGRDEIEPQTVLPFLGARLAGSATSCPEATPLLDTLLSDPAFDTPLAAFELADLVRVAPPADQPRLRDALGRQFEAWLARAAAPEAGGGPVSLSEIVSTMGAASDLGVAIDVPAAVRRRGAGQTAMHGRLSDVSDGPPQLPDLMIQEWLVGNGALDAPARAETARTAVAEPDAGDDHIAVGNAMMRDHAVPDCETAATLAAERAQARGIATLLGTVAATTRDASCRDALDVEALLADAAEGSASGYPVLDTWATLYAVCWTDASLLPEHLAPLAIEEQLADDPLFKFAWAFSLTPKDSCAEIRRGSE